VILGTADPMTTGFPASVAFVKIVSQRTETKSGKETQEDRYYLSSQAAEARTPEEWINLTRSHWAGVENRNHWCRDATQGEDRLRLKHPVAVANLALIRNLNLKLLHWDNQSDWLPAKRERLICEPSLALELLLRK